MLAASTLYCTCFDKSNCLIWHSIHHQLNPHKEDSAVTTLSQPARLHFWRPSSQPPCDTIHVAMQTFRYPPISIHMNMINHTQVVDIHWSWIICRSRLLLIVHGKLHVLAEVNNKGIHSHQLILDRSCINYSQRHLLLIQGSLHPCHFDVSSSLKTYELSLLRCLVLHQLWTVKVNACKFVDSIIRSFLRLFLEALLISIITAPSFLIVRIFILHQK